jgi:DNA repair exonuclease SbcCD ATPase subunit
MKIVKLQAENFKRISAVTIEPSGAAVVVGGRNAQGKSSVLDAIESALCGGKAAPADPIKHGAKSARVVVETDTGLTVTREFSGKGSRLKVQAKDGAAYGSPQTMLDELIGSVSFDPLKFARMKPDKRAETLRQLSGVDTSDLEAKRAGVFAERTDVNRDLKAARNRLDAAPHHEDAPAELVSVSALSADLSAAVEHNAVCDAANVDAEAAQAGEAAWLKRYELKKAELAEAKAGLKKVEETATKLAKAAQSLKRLDVAPINDAIASAEDVNAMVRDNKAHEALAFEVDAAGETAEALTDRLSEIDEQIAAMTAAAKYPIKGLSVDADGVSYNGVPFEQASDAEQISICVAIGLALNKELKVLRVRDGSLLDDESLALVVKLAEDAGAQVWIERVGDGEECTVVIEDGSVSMPGKWDNADLMGEDC